MKILNRRSFLSCSATTALGMFASPEAPGAAAAPLRLPPPPKGYAAEAERITQATLRRFWKKDVGMFKASVPSAEAVPSDAAHHLGYVFWPSQIALHALVEGAKHEPTIYAPQIRAVFSGLEKYYNPDRHAYNAWLHFAGNNDAYYDDNAWAVITLIEAHNAVKRTHPAHATSYRERAVDIMAKFLRGGWDDTGKPGGVRWGTDPAKDGTADKTVSATAGAALAAILLARSGSNVTTNTAWASMALSWIWERLRDTDNLILDGLKAPDWTVMPVKWTYNTGVTMRAYAEHYHLSRSRDSLEKATTLARVALDHTSRLYDGLVHDPARRFFYDDTYFVHFLLDGLLQVREITPDKKLAARITAEVRREANYAYNYIRDTNDGFYWRNWRLWCIGPEQLAQWERLTGQTTALQTDKSERSSDGKQWVKTLLANASAARLFWIASRA